MQRKLQILLIILLPIIVLSQEKILLVGVGAGINFTKFSNDSVDFRTKIQPALGVFGNYKLTNNLFANLSADYSLRSSLSQKPYLKITNQYVDLGLKLQYEFYKGVYFNAGALYSYMLASNVSYHAGSSEKFSINTYSSEVSVVLGMGFRVSRAINIEFNYFVPTSNSIKTNFQIGVAVELNNKKIPKPKTFRQIVNEKSKQQIKELKNGILLVRLHKNKKSIDALKLVGKYKKAKRKERKQKKINMFITNGFENNFDYCEYRFFYSENTNKVNEKYFKNIFLNSNLEIDSSITVDTLKPIYIAEFNILDEDTAKYFSEITYRHNEEGNLVAEENYYTGSSISFKDLVIKDSSFIQLQRPFPYCTRGPNFLRKGVSGGHEIIIKGEKNPFSRRIYKMNKNLHRFYSFSNQKKNI